MFVPCQVKSATLFNSGLHNVWSRMPRYALPLGSDANVRWIKSWLYCSPAAYEPNELLFGKPGRLMIFVLLTRTWTAAALGIDKPRLRKTALPSTWLCANWE